MNTKNNEVSKPTKDQILLFLAGLSLILFFINWVFSIPAIILSYREYKRGNSEINRLTLEVSSLSCVLYTILVIVMLLQARLPMGQEIIDPGEDPTYHNIYMIE